MFFQIVVQLQFRKSKFLGPLSQPIASNHSNVFCFILLLSRRREGESWENPNQMILFVPPHNTISLTFPSLSTLTYSATLLTTSLSLSLSLNPFQPSSRLETCHSRKFRSCNRLQGVVNGSSHRKWGRWLTDGGVVKPFHGLQL
jgi:hypothetical protein